MVKLEHLAKVVKPAADVSGDESPPVGRPRARSLSMTDDVNDRSRSIPVGFLDPATTRVVQGGRAKATTVDDRSLDARSTGGARAQRRSPAEVSPISFALGFDTTADCVAILGSAQHQALSDSYGSLAPLLRDPRSCDLVRSLATNQNCDSKRITTVARRLVPLLAIGFEAVDLDAAQVDLLLAGNDTEFRWQLLNECERDVRRATELIAYLDPYVDSPERLQLARSQLALVGDIAVAAPRTAFLVDYLDGDPRRFGCARTELDRAGGDEAAARREIETLAKYHYDPVLRDRARLAATAAADPAHSKAVVDAAKRKKDTIDAIERPKSLKRGTKGQAKAAYDKKMTGVRAAETAAEQTETADTQAAEVQHAADRDRTLVAIEQFLGTAAGRGVSEADAAWIIESTNFDARLAGELFGVFDANAPDARDASTRLLAAAGARRDVLNSGVEILRTARQVPGVTAEAPVEVALWCMSANARIGVEQVTVLTLERSNRAGDWVAVTAYLAVRSPHATEAIDALKHARLAGLGIADLRRKDGVKVKNLAWVLQKTGADAVARTVAFDLLDSEEVTAGNTTSLAWLLGLRGVPGFDGLVRGIRLGRRQLSSVEKLLTDFAGRFGLETFGRWIHKFDLELLRQALDATAYDSFETFVDEFLALRDFGHDGAKIELIRLQACLRAGRGAFAVSQPDVDYARRKDNPPARPYSPGTYPRRTGFLRLTGAGAVIEVHTHWNTKDNAGKDLPGEKSQVLVSIHVQVGGGNGLEINQWRKWFGVVEDAVCAAHNAAVGNLAPRGGKLSLGAK